MNVQWQASCDGCYETLGWFPTEEDAHAAEDASKQDGCRWCAEIRADDDEAEASDG